MPQTRECDYCSSEIPPGTGTMFVRTDGTTIHYCSSKCEKNAELGREPRDLEWIQDEEAERLARAEEGAEESVEESVEEPDVTEEDSEDDSADADEAETSDEADADETEADDEDVEEDDEE
ncbi:50S ribosomal protein L24e [Salinarchaeum sp. Harcht-Bsk1]|uniref:50S ribosomal protein L24e n=1 Tax=Salinarchaeum sp. Harcht-Bsk1 TaxID=1333523 RepID=UPI0006780EF1|nr:50S ribosomal protein L24e [Salinarchaeum sp. Harcht-Bsk1]